MAIKDLYLFSGRTSLAVSLLASLFIVVIDFVTPPALMVSIFFIIPVLLVAWHNGFRWAAGLSIALPLARYLIGSLLESLWAVEFHLINAIDRIVVLLVVSYVVSRLSESVKHIRTLEGMLPICSNCKKIRSEGQIWQPLEKYIGDHSEAKFTHGLCPDCAKIFFP